jgi:Na+(H+)/acetate symporter ActP
VSGGLLPPSEVSTAAVAVVVALTIGVGAYGIRVARTKDDFLVAARVVPPMLNASAISGEYLSAASFLGVAGLVLAGGLGALWYPVGYAAGYLVLLLLVAAPLRRFGAYTIPDFAVGRLDAPGLRPVATLFVLAISWFYLLPQLKGAGITLQVVLGTPYWVGVVVLGVVVTGNIIAGGMRGITLVQSFLYWIKLAAIAIPALVLLAYFHHANGAALDQPVPPTFPQRTTVHLDHGVAFRMPQEARVSVDGRLDGRRVDGTVRIAAGRHTVGGDTDLTFPAGAAAPHLTHYTATRGTAWASPFVDIGQNGGHPLAATFSLLLATFLGTIGLPHILVRFYTNPNGVAARRTTSIVLLLVGAFYLFPVVYGAFGRLIAPSLYLTGGTDSVVLVLPRLALPGLSGNLLGALVAAGAFAAFLSTTSGLLVSVAGAISHDLLGGSVRAFRGAAVVAGATAVVAGLYVGGFPINVLVGWAFAVAASSFCPLLVLGIWWRGLTWKGAAAGLVAGGGASSAAILATMVGAGHGGWSGLLLSEPAIWTVPLAFVVMTGVSLVTRGSLPADVAGKLLQLHLPERLARRAPVSAR